MLLKRPILFRKRYANLMRVPPKATPPITPLMLVSASYSADDVQLTLAFDRAIDVAGVAGAAIVINDGAISGLLLDATGGTTLVDPVTVRFDLNVLGGASGSETVLDASSGNGIVASDDGAAWSGASDLELPFP